MELPGEPYDEGESPAAAPAWEATAAPQEAPTDTGQEVSETPAQPAAGGGREEQMDAIRRMLDDLKRSAEDEPEPEPEPEPQRPASPQPTMRRRDEEDALDEDAGGDPLRSRIRQLEGQGRGTETAKTGNYDATRLRKMHERRAKRLQKAKERKRKSGAFLTGFTLVAAVTATMVGLYVLHPQIIAASPEMEPAMNEYVVTVDRYRLALDDATADWRSWVNERIAQLSGGKEAQSGGGAEPAATQ